MLIPIDEVVYFDITTHHPTTGAVTDADATPTFDVYEEATDTGLLGATNLTKRTSLTGDYRGTFTASAANGFEAGKWYSVIVSATVNSIAAKYCAKNFRVAPAEVIAGVPKGDVAGWLGTVPSTPTVAGVPNVNAKTWNDLATVALPLVPTTAGRTLDVSAGGEAGVDWANVGTPGSTVALSATTVKTLTDAPADSSGTTTLLSRLSSARAGYLDNLSAGAVALASSLTTLAGKFTGITLLSEWLGLIAGKQTGNTTARTELRATGAGSGTYDETTDSQEAARDRGDAAWVTGTTPPTAAAVADAVWDETLSDHLAGGSTGAGLNAAGSAGDPWSTAIPGAYGAGSAGKILGDNLNATVSSRASQTSVDDVPTNAELATALGTADDATLAAIAALNNLSQANIRTAVGLASANLDTQLDALPTNAELATALGTADDATLAAIAALSIPTAAQNAAALMDLSNGVETGLTPRQALRLMTAALAGKLSGAATTTIVIRNAVADSKDRVTATVDADGNRSAVTVDLT